MLKVKIAGVISFLSSIGWIIFVLFVADVSTDLVTFYFLMILFISTILYIVWTKFGEIKPNELKNLEYENKILQKRLEQKELKAKLKEKT